jgi:2-polyprenyl-6-hydroxyphenyl methylase/3-demethylubiquinone-9 3-methyltransferase
MAEARGAAFNFGENWQAFSAAALNEQRFAAAGESLRDLVGPERIAGRSFLDIGCGSGIFALAAALTGARRVVGIDLSAESVAASEANRARFAPGKAVEFLRKSVFDGDLAALGTFDVVYSWGVLHHTGDMWRAIDAAAAAVSGAPGALLVLALYNRHWSSPAWKIVKRLYNISPRPVRKVMVWKFCAVIAAAKFAVTRRNPFRQRRGMSFYHDVVDWVGGYPYEYATREEVIARVEGKGLACVKVMRPVTPTGCNQFVFERR